MTKDGFLGRNRLMSTRLHLLLLAAGTVPLAFTQAGPNYGDDLAFLKKHTPIVELSSGEARVAIAPAWQGRVMTSTAAGAEGAAFGWINREVIEIGIKPEAQRDGLQKHIHVFGGEERLWLGPEGGPFALFFPPKVPQTFDNWKTPALMDTEPFEIEGAAKPTSVSFRRKASLPNRAGTVLSFELRRDISLAEAPALARVCGGELPEGIKAVGYETRNNVKNTGDKAWTKETGAPSIWLLGMFKPTDGTTIVIPIRVGTSDDDLGPKANTSYAGFPPIPEDRVRITKPSRLSMALFFKGDGKARGKLGIPPKRQTGLAGSWQADLGVLTLVKMAGDRDPATAAWPYVDSQWKEDGDPFAGDVINSYNDGAPEPGAKPLGPFYEIETSGPAMLLAPGASFTHAQTTVHLTGPRPALDAVAKRTLGVGLDEIEKALP